MARAIKRTEGTIGLLSNKVSRDVFSCQALWHTFDPRTEAEEGGTL